ncbi:putative metal-nicotianamine transporter YSL6 [Vitis vinifera]|uniref:Putative metal-nicotianamine transporter YSL6 n=1 Tax=Vitis vinifera TaxID=29760 RepID=A0A438JDC9_VITVI|nr:putative metal-nicotianamine transporter YSL6 [Vitis vinifera]
MGTEQGAAVEISEPLLLDSGKVREVELEERIPEWRDQITLRGLVVSAVMGSLFCIITHKLNLTVGIIPSLNVAAGLLGFFFVKSWTGFLSTLGFSVRPFTRQENTVIQTCVVACYGLAFSDVVVMELQGPNVWIVTGDYECAVCNGKKEVGVLHRPKVEAPWGFGSYLLAMDERTYQLIGVDYPGNRAEDVLNPGLGWMIGFLFVVSFLGLFSLVPLRKVMVMDYELTYPSGTATAMLINSFHTNTGAELAGFYFDFSPTYVGCGLICPHIVNCSVLLGAIISWGFLWPFISQHAGDWYPADLGSNDFKGRTLFKISLRGGPHLSLCALVHEVFIAISLILGDGLYNLIKIISITVKEMWNSSTKQNNLPIIKEVLDSESSKLLMQRKKQDEIFLKDQIPSWVAASGYVGLAAISTATIPVLFPALKWYLVLSSYIIAPALAFCNSYGTGLTDWSLASTYGKIGLFIIASVVGGNGGVVAGLVACGVMMSIVSTAADLMQDFKTGYLTLSSAKSIWSYKAPYAVIFREMAILGVEGFSELPKHCLAICCGFFVAALVINLLRDVTPAKVSQFIPIPMAMAVPFYIGAYFAIDMFVGTVILFVWERMNRKGAEDFAGAVASGLICGDGIWTIPSASLSIFRINPPVCMYFGPSLSR